MILVIDNYDSFTYNLVQALGELGAELHVCRNDKITVAEVEAMNPERLIISPGPCTPTEAGISCEAIKTMSGKVPVLGVCLGHQSIAQAFGGEVIRADEPVHGKTSEIRHNNDGVFVGLDNPLVATRYHSLIVRESSLPECLEATAWTVDSDILMGIRHRDYPVFGVQFHPESFLTASGSDLLRNFLEI